MSRTQKEPSQEPVSVPDGQRAPPRFDMTTYEAQLQRLLDGRSNFLGFDEIDANGETAVEGTDAGVVLLRHDVSISLSRALVMARLEATLRVRSTYCVLVDSPLFDGTLSDTARTIRTMSRLGHDIGLLFDPHRFWEAEPDEAAVRTKIDAERDVLERLLGERVDVVGFHDPPEWVRDLTLPTLRNAEDSVFSEPSFVRHEDRNWRTARPFADGVPTRLHLEIHPGLWHTSDTAEVAVLDKSRRTAHRRVDSHLETYEKRNTTQESA